ncbi:hypothetical protein [Nannocystis pusilla]|uniref:Lipoprotein n=1 Tax=Nannocystis pusilla TaxID=889268 RepID=A0ABS7TX56_9BACT|nr:hypothetical protein [Nannocystis pusilla]MBZ5712844.1 hypothetical protein [Nannocystis pusilla]
MSKHLFASLSALVLATSISGCDDGTAANAESIEVPDDSAVSELDAGDFVIARVSLPNGGIIKFLGGSPDGAVALSEKYPNDSSAVAHAYSERFDATPLEIFMALEPDAEIPEALFEDHALKAAGGEAEAEPRLLPGLDDLKIPLDPMFAIWNGGGACTDSTFHTMFQDRYMANGFSNHLHYPNQTVNNTTLTLPLAADRAFGICQTGGVSPFSVSVDVEKETSTGVWTPIDSDTVGLGFSLFFREETPVGGLNLPYRMRVRNVDAGDAYRLEAGWLP